MRRFLVPQIALVAIVATLAPHAAHAEIMDRLDEPAADVVCTKWWGTDL